MEQHCLRRTTAIAILASACLSAAGQAATNDGAEIGAEARESSSRACVEVEVDGYRSISYDCLAEQMAPPKQRPDVQTPTLAAEATARRAPNQLGLFNQAAFGNRMGANAGRSVYPQRPPTYSAPPVMPGPIR